MKKKILVFILIISIILLCTACSAIKPTRLANTVHIDIDDLDSNTVGSVVANNTINSCVRVLATFSFGGTIKENSGAGFILTEDGYIITNRHVVVTYIKSLTSPQFSDKKNDVCDTPLAASTIKIVWADKDAKTTFVNASVVDFSQNDSLDIAILKIDSPLETYIPLEIDRTTTLYYGQDVYTFGNPENIGLAFSKLMISNPSIKLTSSTAISSILLDGNVNHGNSGGALINSNSKCVGLIFARIESNSGANGVYGLGCAISASNVISFVDSIQTTKGIQIDYKEYKPE